MKKLLLLLCCLPLRLLSLKNMMVLVLAYAQDDNGKIMQYEFSTKDYKPFKQTPKQLMY